MPTFSSSGGGGGYDYVQSGEPTDAVEGEEWYDTDANAAYVYDGAGWIEQTVTDHGEIGDVQPGQHRSDDNIRATVHDRPSAGDGLSEDENGNFNFVNPADVTAIDRTTTYAPSDTVYEVVHSFNVNRLYPQYIRVATQGQGMTAVVTVYWTDSTSTRYNVTNGEATFSLDDFQSDLAAGRLISTIEFAVDSNYTSDNKYNWTVIGLEHDQHTVSTP